MTRYRSGVEVLGGSSIPSEITTDGVLPTALSRDEPNGWADACDDIDAVHVVRPNRPDAPELVAPFLSETPESTHVVLPSERCRDEIVESGQLTFAIGRAGVAWIDARDIAAVAERALTAPSRSSPTRSSVWRNGRRAHSGPSSTMSDRSCGEPVRTPASGHRGRPLTQA